MTQINVNPVVVTIDVTADGLIDVGAELVGIQGPPGSGGGGGGGPVAWNDVTGKPTTFPPSGHSHAINDTTGLQGALDGKAASSHTHVAANITDFATAADARVAAHVALADPHAQYQRESEKGAANGYPALDGTGKIPTSQLPALALTDVFVVASQAAQLALVAEEGDVAIRSDQNKSYIHNGGSAGTMADWSELLTPTDAVLSVAGRTGAVVLASTDVTDFQAAVAANSAVAANTAKVTNANHTGDVTGSGALTVQPVAISGKPLVTAVGADHVLILDATDGQLKKALASDFGGGGGGGSGDVVGPASATDNAIARFEATTGKLLQNSAVTVTDAGELRLPLVATPAAPGTDTIGLFGRKLAGRMYPAFIGPSGLEASVQPFLARNKIGYWNPPGNATQVPGVFGFTAPTVTGFTATARNIATTNLFTQMRRLGYVTTAIAGQVGHWRGNARQFTIGNGAGRGGFSYIIRFGISDPATVSDARMLMGMSVIAAPSNVEPSTLTDTIGVGHGAADTNLKLFYGGSAAQTPIDLGAGFPITAGSVEMYELALFAPPGTTDVTYQVTRLSDRTSASGTLTGTLGVALPLPTTLLGYWGFRTNNASALVVAIDVAGAYLETDD
jgi:hypothetical protein